MLNNISPFRPRSLCWLLLLTQVILIGAYATPAAKAVVDHDILKRQGHRTLYRKFPETYLGRVEKGRYLLGFLSQGSEEAQKHNGGVSVSSPYQDYSDLERWGWSQSASRYPFDSNLFGDAPIEPNFYGNWAVFKDPVLPVVKTDNIAFSSLNDMPFQESRGGPLVEPSNAIYENIINPTYGAIIYDSNWSPQHMVTDRNKGNIPHLNALSDIVFFQWLQACQLDKVDPKKLKVAYRLTIITRSTWDTIDLALKNANHELAPGWENRKVFTMKEDEGAAILGTSHGAGIAWLLIQHKHALGTKTIAEVAVWKDVGSPFYCLRFTIKDA
ncbi:hypothetical protein LX32DRAFT_712909 [Colletotrichum zoysiae]|uniref:Uncharacterized protein n=1 Tax=Colletotrichum zoysiae TaxID=1216348 RepID=A0AAD9M7R5_9PEZI|nr:hypothetical protein LX32DRAFT_712909 [Colletotrichum zoysiae]